jgi:hypothetical protein
MQDIFKKVNKMSITPQEPMNDREMHERLVIKV